MSEEKDDANKIAKVRWSELSEMQIDKLRQENKSLESRLKEAEKLSEARYQIINTQEDRLSQAEAENIDLQARNKSLRDTDSNELIAYQKENDELRGRVERHEETIRKITGSEPHYACGQRDEETLAVAAKKLQECEEVWKFRVTEREEIIKQREKRIDELVKEIRDFKSTSIPAVEVYPLDQELTEANEENANLKARLSHLMDVLKRLDIECQGTTCDCGSELKDWDIAKLVKDSIAEWDGIKK